MSWISDLIQRMKRRVKVKRNGKNVTVNLNWTPTLEQIQRAQVVLDTQVWQDVQKYMPIDSGALRQQTNELNILSAGTGTTYLYPAESDYGHYQYEGVLYVDPVYKCGAFPIKRDGAVVGFRSRLGVQKVPSERKLVYKDPNAQAHWGEVAMNNHLKEWVRLVKRCLR